MSGPGEYLTDIQKRLEDLEGRVDALESKSPKRKKFAAPSLDEVEAYIKEKGYHFSSLLFYDRNEANGWTTRLADHSLVPMVSWKGVCATWEQNWRRSNGNQSDAVVRVKTEVDAKESERMKKLEDMATRQLEKLRAAGALKKSEDELAETRPEVEL